MADRWDRPDDRGGHESVSDSHPLDTEHREGLQASATFVLGTPPVPPVTQGVPGDLGNRAAGSAGDPESGPQADWVRLARDGDEEAFAALVRTHQDRLYAIALRLTGDPHDAQDAVQDSLLRAWQGLPSFHGDARFSTWVTRIVINQCHNLRRATRPVQPLEGVEPASTAAAADTLVVAGHQWRATETAVLSLPFDQRTALVLHTFAGYTHAETGRILGITEAAAKVRVHRARKALVAAMQDWR
jgi:RNA polymerase sigma-70 factor (ECF subfamily)